MIIVGPGFPQPDRADIPPICDSGRHRFKRSGVCTRCRRTVPQLAFLGLAEPVDCQRSGVHVVIGPNCITCGEPVSQEQEGDAQAA